MSQIQTRKSDRKRMLSLLQLQDSNDKSQKVVTELINKTAILETEDANTLYQVADELKQACQSYAQANKELVQYHIAHGNASEAKAMRKVRFNTINVDAKEPIDIINLQLKDLHLDAVSDIIV